MTKTMKTESDARAYVIATLQPNDPANYDLDALMGALRAAAADTWDFSQIESDVFWMVAGLCTARKCKGCDTRPAESATKSVLQLCEPCADDSFPGSDRAAYEKLRSKYGRS